MRHFYPVIAYFIQDSLEGALLSGVKLGATVANPCRVCFCPLAECNNAFHQSRMREEVSTLLFLINGSSLICSRVRRQKQEHKWNPC